MKKLLVIAICLTLLVIEIVPSVAFAEEQQPAASSQTNLYLINPVALVTSGNYLFVADNVSDNESVILCFYVSSSAPRYLNTYSLSGRVVNLSVANNVLYVIAPSSVITLKIDSENGLSLVKGETYAIENAVDFTYGKNPIRAIESGYSEYAIASSALSYYNVNTSAFISLPISLSDGKACVTLSDYIYYLGKDADNKVYVNSYSGLDGSSLQFSMDIVSFNGMTTSGDELVLFDNYDVYTTTNVTGQSSSNHGQYATAPVGTSQKFQSTEKIVDVATSFNRYFVLNDKNKVSVYEQKDATYELTYNIGSETVDLNTIPTKFDGFTLVKPTGYPTNIIYKTTDSKTSIEEIVKNNNEEIIVLHFDGADALPYYYVLVGEKYGWVKKSDNAETPQQDAKLNKVNNAVSGDITYNGKFNSLKSVYVYSLPLSNSQYETFEQSVSNLVTPTILQKYVEPTEKGDNIWYYVSYRLNDETHFGFVQSSAISSFYPVATEAYTASGNIVDKKINASLFQAVSVYLTADMAESELISNSNGEMLKLYSGDRVTVIKAEADATFIQVEKDNALYFGWINSANLVGLHQMTTNAIVGLIVLAVAIVLAVLFILLFWRKKSKKGAPNTAN